MVRREVMNKQAAYWADWFMTCCASSVGDRPTPVSIGAPDSRPQA
jgi:hypothetical protein